MSVICEKSCNQIPIAQVTHIASAFTSFFLTSIFNNYMINMLAYFSLQIEEYPLVLIASHISQLIWISKRFGVVLVKFVCGIAELQYAVDNLHLACKLRLKTDCLSLKQSIPCFSRSTVDTNPLLFLFNAATNTT